MFTMFFKRAKEQLTAKISPNTPELSVVNKRSEAEVFAWPKVVSKYLDEESVTMANRPEPLELDKQLETDEFIWPKAISEPLEEENTLLRNPIFEMNDTFFGSIKRSSKSAKLSEMVDEDDSFDWPKVISKSLDEFEQHIMNRPSL